MHISTIDDVRQAANVMAQHLSPAPLVRSHALEQELGLPEHRRVWLKDYGWTPVGSFKLLGALNWMDHHCEWIAKIGMIFECLYERMVFRKQIGKNSSNVYALDSNCEEGGNQHQNDERRHTVFHCYLCNPFLKFFHSPLPKTKKLTLFPTLKNL